MKSNLTAADRIVGHDGSPEPASHAGRMAVETHDRVAHLTTVVERRRVFCHQLSAVGRVLDELLLVAKNAAKTAEGFAPYDGGPSILAHNLEHQEKRKIVEAIRRNDRELAVLEAELDRAKRLVA